MSIPTTTPPSEPSRLVGLWMIGAFGGVGSTVALGLSALARGLSEPTGLVTALPAFEPLGLDAPSSFVIGGHDIRRSSFSDAIEALHERSGVFDANTVVTCRPELDDWSDNVCPGVVLNSGPTIAKMADLPEVNAADNPREAITRIQNDLLQFQKTHGLEQVVVLNVASTEPPFQLGKAHQSLAALNAALDDGEADVLPASSLYAYAALDLGFPHVNFTPSLGSSLPALDELARERGTVHAGQDGKTGETLMKTVLAPMFARRNLQVLSWVGHNIFGNRDGQVLNDPANKASKVGAKDAVVPSIVGYKPQTLVTIEYIESMDDWKTAWNHIHYRGFLGTKMILQFIWQGCDSLLAAPLAIDTCRLALHAQKRGERGMLRHLACFFKNPMGVTDHDFFTQSTWLDDYVRSASS
jgi:myo-inositol-1-phosphate synthase